MKTYKEISSLTKTQLTYATRDTGDSKGSNRYKHQLAVH